MMRLTTAPLTLSTGQTIAAGTPIGVHSKSVNDSTTLHSTPGPDVFDGLRSYRLRQQEGHENLHQFVSTGPAEGLDFGHGIHACPVREAKVADIGKPANCCLIIGTILCEHRAQDCTGFHFVALRHGIRGWPGEAKECV